MKYAHTIFSESFSQINKLLEKTDGEEFETDLNECNIALFLLASKSLVSFKTIIPDQIIVLDSGNFSDAAYTKMLERYCEMLGFSGSTSKVVCSSGKIITRSEDGEPLELGSERKRSISDSEESSSKKAKLATDISDSEDKSFEEAVGESKAAQSKSEKEQSNIEKTTRSSRVILYMMREEAKKQANNDSGKLAQEFCVVNASKVMSKIDKESLEQYSKEMGSKVAATITKSILRYTFLIFFLVFYYI